MLGLLGADSNSRSNEHVGVGGWQLVEQFRPTGEDQGFVRCGVTPGYSGDEGGRRWAAMAERCLEHVVTMKQQQRACTSRGL